MKLKLPVHDRTKKLLEGTISQGAASILTNITRFILVIILIRYYSKEEFGLWSTITSSAAVIATGDFGIINALRNKMSNLIVLGKKGLDEGRLYFFSSFYFFVALAIVLSTVVYYLSTILPFEDLFKTDNTYLKHQGTTILLWIQFLFFINMPLSLGSPLFFSFQEAKLAAIFSFLQSMFSFISVIALVWIKASIVTISVVYFSANVFTGLSGTVFFLYKRQWFNFRIPISRLFEIIKDLISVGWKFMGLQLSKSYLENIGVILSSAILGISVAAEFSLVQKFYTFGMSVYVSMLNPLWSGYADAYARKDIQWCKRTLSKSMVLTIFYFITLLGGILIFGNTVIKLIGSGNYNIAYNVYFLLGLLTLSIALFDCSSLILNATNKITLKLILSIIICIVAVPICKKTSLTWGLEGLTAGLAITWGIMALVLYLQSYRSINKIA